MTFTTARTLMTLLVSGLLGGCAHAPCDAPAHGSPHAVAPHDGAHGASHGSPHGGHDGPLVHRFDDPAKVEAMLEGPDRDAYQQPEVLVGLLGITPGMRVVDLGAGTGYLEPYLSRAVGPEGEVLAVDVEAPLVRHLLARVAREGLANVQPRLGLYEDPLLAPASADRVLIVNTWHHIAAREAYAGKLAQALRPGGRVFVVDFTLESEHGPAPAHRVTPEQVIAELTAGGLRASLVDEPLREQFVVVGEQR